MYGQSLSPDIAFLSAIEGIGKPILCCNFIQHGIPRAFPYSRLRCLLGVYPRRIPVFLIPVIGLFPDGQLAPFLCSGKDSMGFWDCYAHAVFLYLESLGIAVFLCNLAYNGSLPPLVQPTSVLHFLAARSLPMAKWKRTPAFCPLEDTLGHASQLFLPVDDLEGVGKAILFGYSCQDGIPRRGGVTPLGSFHLGQPLSVRPFSRGLGTR